MAHGIDEVLKDEESLSLRLSSSSNSWAVSDQEAVFLAMVRLMSGVTTLEVRFIASNYSLHLNN